MQPRHSGKENRVQTQLEQDQKAKRSITIPRAFHFATLERSRLHRQQNREEHTHMVHALSSANKKRATIQEQTRKPFSRLPVSAALSLSRQSPAGQQAPKAEQKRAPCVAVPKPQQRQLRPVALLQTKDRQEPQGQPIANSRPSLKISRQLKPQNCETQYEASAYEEDASVKNALLEFMKDRQAIKQVSPQGSSTDTLADIDDVPFAKLTRRMSLNAKTHQQQQQQRQQQQSSSKLTASDMGRFLKEMAQTPNRLQQRGHMSELLPEFNADAEHNVFLSPSAQLQQQQANDVVEQLAQNLLQRCGEQGVLPPAQDDAGELELPRENRKQSMRDSTALLSRDQQMDLMQRESDDMTVNFAALGFQMPVAATAVPAKPEVKKMKDLKKNYQQMFKEGQRRFMQQRVQIKDGDTCQLFFDTSLLDKRSSESQRQTPVQSQVQRVSTPQLGTGDSSDFDNDGEEARLQNEMDQLEAEEQQLMADMNIQD